MRQLMKLELAFLAGCSLAFSLLVGCSGDDSASANNEDLNNPLERILRPATNVATVHQSRAEVEQYVREHKTEFMPIMQKERMKQSLARSGRQVWLTPL